MFTVLPNMSNWTVLVPTVPATKDPEWIPKCKSHGVAAEFAISLILYAQSTQDFIGEFAWEDKPATATIASPTVLIFSKPKSSKVFSKLSTIPWSV